MKTKYDGLKTVKASVDSYKEAIDTLLEAGYAFSNVIGQQEGKAFEKLHSEADQKSLGQLSVFSSYLEDLSSYIDNYIELMTDYVAPNDSSQTLYLKKSDISFNLWQLHNDLDLFNFIKNDTGSGIYFDEVFIWNPFDSDEDNESRKSDINARNASKKAAREANYNLLANFRDNDLATAITDITGAVDEMQRIFDDYVEPYSDQDSYLETKLQYWFDGLDGVDPIEHLKFRISSSWSGGKMGLLPDWMTVDFMEDMDGFINSFIPEDMRKEHRANNDKFWNLNESIYTIDGLIEYQGKMGDFKYGNVNSHNPLNWIIKQLTGIDDDINSAKSDVHPDGSIRGYYNMCEVIATYNALIATGCTDFTFPELLEKFEEHGISGKGMIGSSMQDIVKTINEVEGYRANLYKTDRLTPADYKRAEVEGDVFIFSTFNDNKEFGGFHTMCITKEDNGTYVLHNAYNSPDKVFNSLQEAVEGYYKKDGRQTTEPISLITIQKEEVVDEVEKLEGDFDFMSGSDTMRV